MVEIPDEKSPSSGDEDEDMFSVASYCDEALADEEMAAEPADESDDEGTLETLADQAQQHIDAEEEDKPVTPDMSGEALDKYVEGADRAPFGIPAAQFRGEGNSTQMARDQAEVVIESMPHWEESITLSNSNKSLWTALVKNNRAMSEWPRLADISKEDLATSVAQALASVDFPPGHVDSMTEHTGDSRPCNTNGRWFFLDFTKTVLDDFFADPLLWNNGQSNWQTAYHGTALHNLPRVLHQGLLKGPNTLQDRNGTHTARIYCEGSKRRMCSFMYSTHVGIPFVNPCLFFGVLLELLADRSRGDTKHHQWRQDNGSTHLMGAWVHIVDIRDAYEKGYVGTVRVSEPQFRNGVRSLRSKYFLRDAMEYQNAKRHGNGEIVLPLPPKHETSKTPETYYV